MFDDFKRIYRLVFYPPWNRTGTLLLNIVALTARRGIYGVLSRSIFIIIIIIITTTTTATIIVSIFIVDRIVK